MIRFFGLQCNHAEKKKKKDSGFSPLDQKQNIAQELTVNSNSERLQYSWIEIKINYYEMANVSFVIFAIAFVEKKAR